MIRKDELIHGFSLSVKCVAPPFRDMSFPPQGCSRDTCRRDILPGLCSVGSCLGLLSILT